MSKFHPASISVGFFGRLISLPYRHIRSERGQKICCAVIIVLCAVGILRVYTLRVQAENQYHAVKATLVARGDKAVGKSHDEAVMIFQYTNAAGAVVSFTHQLRWDTPVGHEITVREMPGGGLFFSEPDSYNFGEFALSVFVGGLIGAMLIVLYYAMLLAIHGLIRRLPVSQQPKWYNNKTLPRWS